MGRWEGVMSTGDLSMRVVVYFQVPSAGRLGDWYGSGFSDVYWPMEDSPHETNIGTVLISRQTISAHGHSIEFKGSGVPRGPLAVKMGLKE